MAHRHEALFRDDAYLDATEATVVARQRARRHHPRPDRLLRDVGRAAGRHRHARARRRQPRSRSPRPSTARPRTRSSTCRPPEQPLPAVGERAAARNRLGAALSADAHAHGLHLLSVVCPFPITGAPSARTRAASISTFRTPAIDKEDVTARLMELVRADHPVFMQLDHRRGARRQSRPGEVEERAAADRHRPLRLVCIGDERVGRQPALRRHACARTGEVGEIHIGKIEKKGRENRRFRIRFGPLPATEPSLPARRAGERADDRQNSRFRRRRRLAAEAPRRARPVDRRCLLVSAGAEARRAAPNMRRRIFRAPSSSTRTRSSIRTPSLPHTLPSPRAFAAVCRLDGHFGRRHDRRL